MAVHVKYSSFNSVIDCVKIDISREQFLLLTPKTKLITIDDEEKVENFIQVQIIDDEIVHELVTEMSREDLTQLTRIIQQLNKQIGKENNTK